MAEVVAPDHHSRLASSGIAPMAVPGGPKIEMVQNPDFSFPRHSAAPRLARAAGEEDSTRRPASMQFNLPPPESTPNSHRRSASTLPSFTFNAGDTSGLNETDTEGDSPPQTPDENTPATPSRRGHRRGGSEFVGGDSRFGMNNAVSSSPTKTNVLPVPIAPSAPPSGGRRGHAHRRSAAISSHDVSSIISPPEAQPPRLSSSLPNTPLEHSEQIPLPLERASSSPVTDGALSDPFGPPLEDVTARPPSRPRVGFSENVEYIPRPLSTISSETESSMSTVRGHSYNNSINSIVSMGTPSPPSSRRLRNATIPPVEDAPTARAKSSSEISRRIENEGEWLKGRSSNSLKRPLSESATGHPRTTFVEPVHPVKARTTHNKRQSLGHAFGFDRRRSEPILAMSAGETARHSALSLQEPTPDAPFSEESHDSRSGEHFSSAKKIKQWATSKIYRKSRDSGKALTTSSSTSSIRPTSAGSVSVPGKVPRPDQPVAETDLDAVFNSQGMASESQRSGTPPQPRVEFSMPFSSQPSSAHKQELDDSDVMVDLDAALGPNQTPPIGSHRQRKELHSSRLAKDFTGPGGHYHRRTESAPILQPFESTRLGTPSQSSMADVFEEEEEDDDVARSTRAAAEDEGNVGVEIVDSDDSSCSGGAEDGLGIVREGWEPDRPPTAYGNVMSRLSAAGGERRGSSIIEETIVEEGSPQDNEADPEDDVENLEIVEAHEEPRASSLTKSSDSSETPTLLAPQTGVVTLPDGPQSVMTPETYQTSTFSSPDYHRRQGSFDTSRLGTSASSITDNRTMSSCAASDPCNDLRISVDDVPSLTSSRSTMLSSTPANNSRRDFRPSSTNSYGVAAAAAAAAAAAVAAADPAVERRRKRNSVQSLSQLMVSPFGARSRIFHEARPRTAAAEDERESAGVRETPKRKEHRLKKLLFWRSKQASHKPSSSSGEAET